MAPRKKAGPNIGSHVAVQLGDQEWRHFAIAIDPDDVNVANCPKFRRERTLRLGLQMAIERVLTMEGGSTTREVRANLQHSVKKAVAALREMRPET